MDEKLIVYRVGFNGNDETEVDAFCESEAIELARMIAMEDGVEFNLDYVNPCGTIDMDMKIREWYISEYPTDELSEDINREITFYQLYVVLNEYGDVYEALNVWDSIIRERVFDKLAEVMQVDYNYIFKMWLES